MEEILPQPEAFSIAKGRRIYMDQVPEKLSGDVRLE
jgi:hypothetical protein